MDAQPSILQALDFILCGCAVIGAFAAPLILISRCILAPIDRVAKFRRAPAQFSIGDFLCLFLVVQIPLTATHWLANEETHAAFWAFTGITWMVAPVIWYAGARTLSKAGIMHRGHRFVFLGLIMPLIYYGLIPSTGLSIAAVITVFGVAGAADGGSLWIFWTWLGLAMLFALSGVFTNWMLKQVEREHTPKSVEMNETELARTAMYGDSTAVQPALPAARNSLAGNC
jgi:hypothetical protein